MKMAHVSAQAGADATPSRIEKLLAQGRVVKMQAAFRGWRVRQRMIKGLRQRFASLCESLEAPFADADRSLPWAAELYSDDGHHVRLHVCAFHHPSPHTLHVDAAFVLCADRFFGLSTIGCAGPCFHTLSMSKLLHRRRLHLPWIWSLFRLREYLPQDSPSVASIALDLALV